MPSWNLSPRRCTGLSWLLSMSRSGGCTLSPSQIAELLTLLLRKTTCTFRRKLISKTCIWTQIFFHGVNKKLKPALTDSWCFSPAMLYLVLNGCIKLGHNYLQALSISWNYWYYWIKTIFQVKWWSSKLVRCHFLSSLSVICFKLRVWELYTVFSQP